MSSATGWSAIGLRRHWRCGARGSQWSGGTVFRLGLLLIEGALIINENESDQAEALRHITSESSEGIAILVDTVGDIRAVNETLPLMKHDGHIVSAGFYGTEGMIDIQKLRRGEQTLHCPSGWSRPRMDLTLQHIARGELETKSLITHRFPAREARAAWDLIVNGRETSLGIVLEWD